MELYQFPPYNSARSPASRVLSGRSPYGASRLETRASTRSLERPSTAGSVLRAGSAVTAWGEEGNATSASRPLSSRPLSSRASLRSRSGGSEGSLGETFGRRPSSEALGPGGDLGDEVEMGATLLHTAAGQGDRTAIRSFLQTFDVDCADHMGRTPLMYAVIANKPKAAEVLLKQGANVMAPDVNGRTAILWCAYYGHHEIMRVLLKHDRTIVAAVDPGGRTALHWATKHDSTSASWPLICSLNTCTGASLLGCAGEESVFVFLMTAPRLFHVSRHQVPGAPLACDGKTNCQHARQRAGDCATLGCPLSSPRAHGETPPGA